MRGIVESEVVIAEITPPNPNVFYELGFAHGGEKQTILLAEKGRQPPFDVGGFRRITLPLAAPGMLAGAARARSCTGIDGRIGTLSEDLCALCSGPYRHRILARAAVPPASLTWGGLRPGSGSA